MGIIDFVFIPSGTSRVDVVLKKSVRASATSGWAPTEQRIYDMPCSVRVCAQILWATLSKGALPTRE